MDISLRILLTAQDAASAAIRGIASNFGPIGVGMAAIGTAAVAAGAASVKMAGDFQSGITSLVTGAGEAQSNVKLVSDGILNLSTVTGTSTKELTDGMYMIESAGYHGSAGLDVLKASAEGAKVGNADLASVANGVTTAMTDYASKGLTASQATNTLVATVAAGKTHMSDLATAMSTILPTSSAVGVSFTDTSAAMATMTGEGTNAASAATYLRQMLMALESPATKGADALKSIGLSTQQVATDMKTSLPGTLQEITDALAKKFPVGSAAYVSALKDIAGGSKQMQGMLELTGEHMKVFQSNMTGITDAVNQGGTAITGWSQVQGDFNLQMDRMKASVDAAMITLGTALLPIITQIVGVVANAIGAFSSWVAQSGALQAVAGLLSTALTNVGQVIQLIVQSVQGSFADLPGQASLWGQNLVTGFANGISSGTGIVGDAINAIISEVSAMIGFMSPTKKGPGKNVNQWGPNLVASFANGITNSVSQVQDAMTQLAQPLTAFNSSIAIPTVNPTQQKGGVSLDQKFAIAQAATAGDGLVQASSSALKSGTPALSSASQGVNSQLTSMCQTAHSVSSCVSTHTASMAKSAATHTSSTAATTAKHAASAQSAAASHAAALQKHQQVVEAAAAKHQQVLQAQAARHAAAVQHHQQVVQAAAVKHQQVLQAAATRHAAALAKQHASGSSSGGSSSLAGGVTPSLLKLPTIAHSAGAQTAAAVASGLSSGTGQVTNAAQKIVSQMGSAFHNGLTAIGSILKNIIQIIGPIISIAIQIFIGLWKTLLVIGQAVGNMLLPALANLSSAITPIIVGILTWIATSGILPIIFNILQIAVTIVIATLSILINVLAAIITWFSTTAVGIAVFRAILLILAVVVLPILIVVIYSVIASFVMWIASAIMVGIANIIAFWPIILIIIAIVAVVALVILIFTHWGEIAHWLQGVWGAFSSWFMGAMGATGAWFQSVWGAIVNWFKGVWGSIGAWFVGIWNGIKTGATNAWNGLINGIRGIINAGVNWLKSVWQIAVNTVVGWFLWLYNHNYYFKDLVDTIIKVFTMLKTDAITIWNDIVAWLSNVWNIIQTDTTAAWDAITSWLENAWNTIYTFFQNVWNNVVSWLLNVWKTIQNDATSAWNAISTWLENVWNTIYKFFQTIWNNVVTWLAGIWKQMLTNTQQGWQTISTIFGGAWNTYIAGPLGSIWNQFTGWFGKLATSFGTFGTQLMQSLASGITGAAGVVGNAIHSAIGNALSAMGFHGIPGFATGVQNFKGGLAMVGENGPELMYLPSGSSVYTQSQMQSMFSTSPTSSSLFAAPPTSSSSAGTGGGVMVGEIHVHLSSNSTDARSQGQQVAQEVQRQLAQLLRGQAIVPRFTSGGRS